MHVTRGRARGRRRVLYLQYTNPAAYPPVDHGVQLLAAVGFQVLVLGTRNSADATGGLAMTQHADVRVRTINLVSRGWLQKLHYLGFGAWTFMWVLRWRPTWLYASDPPSCPFALILRLIPGIRIVYHEHDSPSVSVAASGAGSPFVRLIMWARRRLARQCDIVVLPNEQRAAAYRSVTGRQDTLTVWNCPVRRDVSAKHSASCRDRLRLLYHGSIVPARLPPAVIEALVHLPAGVSLDIVGYETAGQPRYVTDLQELADRLGVGARVRFHGVLATRADLLQLCAQCDVGLALLPRDSSDVNEMAMVGASNKPFDYMACGLPVLVPDLEAWRSTYVEPGFGLSCDPSSPQSIADALFWLLEHPEARAEMGERGRTKISTEWNYEGMFAPVLEQMVSA
jgi:glycosyltransferase involved in cell wall biosynthesis